MKKTDSPTLSDFLKLGESALTVLLGAAKDAKSHTTEVRDSLVRKMDLVTRDEFDAAFAMIKKARKIQDEMHIRLTALEEKMTLSSPQKRVAKNKSKTKT